MPHKGDLRVTLEKGKKVSKQGLTSITWAPKMYATNTISGQKSPGNKNLATTKLEF